MNSGSCSQNVVIMKMAFCLNKFSSSLYFHRYYLPFLYSCCAMLPGLFLKGQRPCWRLTLVETLDISLNFETLFFQLYQRSLPCLKEAATLKYLLALYQNQMYHKHTLQ